MQNAMNADQAIRENQGRRSMQEIPQILGKRVRYRRAQRGMSQEGFADPCGLHGTAMGLLEHSKSIPRLDTLLIVRQHLGLSVSDLLHGIES
jgi:transcriptional regulator with XRE-family HTH domain